MKKKNKDTSVPYININQRITFPDAGLAPPDEPALVGGNLSPGVLLSAYEQGYFPWYGDDQPILWWSPDPRFGFDLKNTVPNKTNRKLLKKNPFVITINEHFEEVIRACSDPRKKEKGTWLTNDMIEAYIRLHHLDRAISVEASLDGNLVGGLYGVSLGKIFCGESMFARVSNASKICFFNLIDYLNQHDYVYLDSQVANEFTRSLGGIEISRKSYLELLRTQGFG